MRLIKILFFKKQCNPYQRELMIKNINEDTITDGGIFKIQYLLIMTNQICNKSSPQEDVEPIWATGARHDVPFATFLWGRYTINQ